MHLLVSASVSGKVPPVLYRAWTSSPITPGKVSNLVWNGGLKGLWSREVGLKSDLSSYLHLGN